MGTSQVTSALCMLSAAEAIRLIAGGQITTTDLIKSCLSRIRELEPTLHAWVCLQEEGSLAAAQAYDERRQREDPIPALQGIPIGVKDIFNTRGEMPTQMGSVLWESFTSGNDARVVEVLRRNGGIVLGKTVTSEFAVHAPGATANPYDPVRTPGTSSSGSAVAVATGMVPLALGSQTAGSTIRPASYCGVYGFKPSFGLIPRTGMLKTTDTLDHVAFFSRTIEDMALLVDHARVSGRNYPFVERYVDSSRGKLPPTRWRVGLVRGPTWSDAEAYAQTAVEEFAARLQACGAVDLADVNLPESFSHVHEAHQRIYCRMLAYYFTQECQHPEGTSRSFQSMVEYGRTISLKDYTAELAFQAEMSALLNSLFDSFDVILNLSTGGEAPVGLEGADRPDNCLIWTFCGVPAMNLPVFAGPSGLPFGAQIVARKYHDYQLLAFAGFLQAHELVCQGPFPALSASPSARCEGGQFVRYEGERHER